MTDRCRATFLMTPGWKHAPQGKGTRIVRCQRAHGHRGPHVPEFSDHRTPEPERAPEEPTSAPLHPAEVPATVQPMLDAIERAVGTSDSLDALLDFGDDCE